MLVQFQEGSSEDLWNVSYKTKEIFFRKKTIIKTINKYSSDDLWRSDTILRRSDSSTLDNIDERIPLLQRIITPTSSRVGKWTESFVKRTCILNILPVVIVRTLNLSRGKKITLNNKC